MNKQEMWLVCKFWAPAKGEINVTYDINSSGRGLTVAVATLETGHTFSTEGTYSMYDVQYINGTTSERKLGFNQASGDVYTTGYLPGVQISSATSVYTTQSTTLYIKRPGWVFVTLSTENFVTTYAFKNLKISYDVVEDSSNPPANVTSGTTTVQSEKSVIVSGLTTLPKTVTVTGPSGHTITYDASIGTDQYKIDSTTKYFSSEGGYVRADGFKFWTTPTEWSSVAAGTSVSWTVTW
jgi:hypothetical protein